MNDDDYVNVYDTDVEDPYHEIKNWLRRNGFKQTDANIEEFTEEVERIKEKLSKLPEDEDYLEGIKRRNKNRKIQEDIVI